MYNFVSSCLQYFELLYNSVCFTSVGKVYALADVINCCKCVIRTATVVFAVEHFLSSHPVSIALSPALQPGARRTFLSAARIPCLPKACAHLLLF